MDRAAVSQARSRGVGLAVKYEGRYPTGPNGEHAGSYQVATGCEVTGTAEQREAVAADFEKLLSPAPTSKIEEWLAELSVITAGRSKDGLEADLMLNAYASRLAAYPADVVSYALIKQSWKWFPTWAEVEAICKARSGPRQHMIAALRKPIEKPEPQRRPPTQAERDAMSALIAEKFGTVPQSWRDQAEAELLKGKCFTDDTTEGKA